jgi:hypothetical protein
MRVLMGYIVSRDCSIIAQFNLPWSVRKKNCLSFQNTFQHIQRFIGKIPIFLPISDFQNPPHLDLLSYAVCMSIVLYAFRGRGFKVAPYSFDCIAHNCIQKTIIILSSCKVWSRNSATYNCYNIANYEK